MEKEQFFNKDRFLAQVRIPMITIISMRVKESESSAMLVDLSAGGARISSQYPLNIGEDITLKIPLPEDKEIEVKGEIVKIQNEGKNVIVAGNIVWAKKMELMQDYNFGVEYMGGIQFKQINEDIQAFIRNQIGK